MRLKTFERLLHRPPGFLLLLFLLPLLASCGREPVYESQSYVFGTLVDITIYGESEERARELSGHVLQQFQRLHEQLHAWQSGSKLDNLNQAFAAGKSTSVSPELAGMLADATRLSEQSGGLFNPAIGHLIQVWGFQSDEFKPVEPDPEEVEKWVAANPQMRDIVIVDGYAQSRNPAVRLDFGGYAKGWALDYAARYLHEQRVAGALVNIGGNIIAIGTRGDRPWRVGIQHPRGAGAIASVDLPDGWAIGTSGDYQRYFERDGRRYCHIIDPRTGQPAQGAQAVSILVPAGARAGTLSDTASKPIFIDHEHWREEAREMGMEHVMFIDAHGTIHLTAAMRQRLKFTDEHTPLDVVP
ncbi:MAG: FAD:protein FMN transferase [Methylobacillus sp.]|jgi:thiamine biosynthesis lipoprotein|nr:FAD:protein FMN transferase [Methylobacillus sp.]